MLEPSLIPVHVVYFRRYVTLYVSKCRRNPQNQTKTVYLWQYSPECEMVNLEARAGVQEVTRGLDAFKHDLVIYLNLEIQRSHSVLTPDIA